MYLVNKENKDLSPLKKCSFSEIGLKERSDLQEWIAKNPACLCVDNEKLLIIQKEFFGWDKTDERLDLLALDQDGNLVIIELKTDNSGRDVTWQAIKYASYCATLTTEQIIGMYATYLKSDIEQAKEKLRDFFDDFDNLELNKNKSQRIILVAADFRQEVTSSVMWLIDRGINIRCIQVRLFELDDKLLLSTEQIIPTPSAEQYLIKLAAKNSENEAAEKDQKSRKFQLWQFWNKFIQDCKDKGHFFCDLSSNNKNGNWLSKGCFGKSGIALQIVLTRENTSVQIEINTPSKEENKKIWDHLYQQRINIESEIGKELEWKRNDNTQRSLIVLSTPKTYLEAEQDAVCQSELFQFLREYTEKFESAFNSGLAEIR